MIIKIQNFCQSCFCHWLILKQLRSMAPTTIKCWYQSDCRRYEITWPQENLYRHLMKETQGAFHLQRGHSLVLRYEDDDGDFINFDTDTEMIRAFGFARNGVLKIYATDGQGNVQNPQRQANGWRKFSEQEKMAARKMFDATGDLLGLVKPEPKWKIVSPEGGLVSLVTGKTAIGDFSITQEREGFGLNPSTAQAFVKVISFGFEAYNAAAERNE